MEQTLKWAVIVSCSTAAEGGKERKERERVCVYVCQSGENATQKHSRGTTRLLLTVLHVGLYIWFIATYRLDYLSIMMKRWW